MQALARLCRMRLVAARVELNCGIPIGRDVGADWERELACEEAINLG